MRNVVRRLMYENGNPSLVRAMIVLQFFVGVVGTFVDMWLTYHGHPWSNYGTFAPLMFGGACTQAVANKFINGKYNSPPGSPGERGEG